MSELKHGEWYIGIPTKPAYGEEILKDGRKVLAVRVVMRIADGPCKDREVMFRNAKWTPESNVHTFRKLRACGWQGKDMDTVVSDIEAAGRRVRFQARWVDVGNGFWAADGMQPDGIYTPQMSAPSQDMKAMMREAIAQAAQMDAAYQAQRSGGRSGGGGDHPNGSSSKDANEAPKQVEGDPCKDCNEKLFKDADGYLTCPNGHDVIPF